MDNFYIKKPSNITYEIFLEYVEDPHKKFEKYVDEIKKTFIIDKIKDEYSPEYLLSV